MFGAKGRIGIILPANNSVLEPEIWPRLPAEVALYTTRILATGELNHEAIRRMEGEVDRAVAELVATIVDVIVYADMVTTFIMEEDWNIAKTEAITERAGVPCISTWTALRDALAALGIRRFALGTPYPKNLHALTRPFFEGLGFSITSDATLDILVMQDVPRVTPGRLRSLIDRLDLDRAEAVVLLATDLPTFASIAALEDETGLPFLTCNQTILWGALRAGGNREAVPCLGRLFEV